VCGASRVGGNHGFLAPERPDERGPYQYPVVIILVEDLVVFDEVVEVAACRGNDEQVSWVQQLVDIVNDFGQELGEVIHFDESLVKLVVIWLTKAVS